MTWPTVSQARWLLSLKELSERKGYAPTFRELSAHNGCASSAASKYALTLLQREGWVTSVSGKARTHAVTSAGLRALGFV